jgi:hypothetical protein
LAAAIKEDAMKWQIVPLLLGVALSAQATEVYRWVDEQGRVHLADSVPDRYKSSATRIVGTVTRANGQPAAHRAGGTDSDCAALHQAYRRSQECFAPFIQANGSVKAEAYQQCGEPVLNPSQKCGPPPSE